MKISEHTFDRLEEFFAQKPISQLIDDGMKLNWGTGSQNLEKNWKIIVPYFVSFSVFEAEFQGRNFTVLTEFLTRNQIVSQPSTLPRSPTLYNII